ncbi:MAG: glycogen debranching enzyme family protein [Candidatus Obscuribacter sp.]|nr:glycogen debranching enzyme family protein [Candidatus Obscuribacter sp.]MBP7578382.1 glycogen debranching enzyme family protein [Candidatus Obscuribacter sp.]
MTFGLTGWLKSRHRELDYEIPVWFPSREKRDNREWLVVNGLGGYAMGTVCGASRRRYHCVLASALTPPVSRSIVLSRVEEQISIDGIEYELATNAWASGVVSPTGYKHLECFTTMPTPTWVYELNGHYLIKRLVMPHGKNEVYLGYTFVPDPDKPEPEVKLSARFLIGFRDFHSEVKGSSDDRYPQFVSPNQTMIILNESGARLCLAWKEGEYEAQKQWWWGYKWIEESSRGEPDTEDLFFVGCVSMKMQGDKEYSIGASFENAISMPDCQTAVEEVIARQSFLTRRASLPRSTKTDMLVLTCDQFLVPAFETAVPSIGRRHREKLIDPNLPPSRLSVIEGYPWFNDSGRAALTALPGLTLATRRFAEAAAILRTFADRYKDGLIANRTLDPLPPVTSLSRPGLEFRSLDTGLWLAWSLYQYYRITRDKALLIELLPRLLAIYRDLTDATVYGITVDSDGLISTNLSGEEFSWMDARVADIPITPRPGKAVELNALWYNFLETTVFLSGEIKDDAAIDTAQIDQIKETGKNVLSSMAKFWDSERNCLFDIIEVPPGPGEKGRKKDESVRPNQLLAVSLPFRTFSREQEKSILHCVETQLLTPMGVRTLSMEDSQYQSSYGCGFDHADQYHRDLSYHQGTAWTWLLGSYIEALINVYGPVPDTINRVRLLLNPLLEHFTEESLLGGISEIFDGGRPHLPRGCPNHAQAVAECMRWQNWLLKQ